MPYPRVPEWALAHSTEADACRSEVLGENRRGLGLLGAVFAEVRYTMSDGLYHVRMPLRTLDPATDPLPMVRSAA